MVNATGTNGVLCACDTGWAVAADGSCSTCADGYYLSGRTSLCELCGAGSYCPGGAAPETACPKGTYGESSGLSTILCSGECPAGKDGRLTGMLSPTCAGECPAGSFCEAGAPPRPCGAVDLFCPAGASVPSNVSAASYTTPVGPAHVQNRTGEAVCPGGFFCSGGDKAACVAGEFCVGAVKTPCVDAASYCGAEASAATLALDGYYTVPVGVQVDGITPLRRVGEARCLQGHQCDGGVMVECGKLTLFSGEGQKKCTEVSTGYYTRPTGDKHRTNRTEQVPCDLGYGITLKPENRVLEFVVCVCVCVVSVLVCVVCVLCGWDGRGCYSRANTVY